MIQAKKRLLAAADKKEKNRDDIQDKIDSAQEKVEQLKKGLPSQLNRMSVSPANQINIRKRVLEEKGRIEDLKSQKLRNQKD